MKIFFSQKQNTMQAIEEDFTPIHLQEAIEKTRMALDIAYAGFNDAVDTDLIDSYIYEINSLQKRYKYLSDLVEKDSVEIEQKLCVHAPIRALIGHSLG